jgi:hypothetical protein
VSDEVEQLPRYEAPPPQYESVVKDYEQPVEMRDLERGEPSGTSGGPPPGYHIADTGNERVSVRRVNTDGSHFGEPPPQSRVPGLLFVRRIFSGFGPFSR